MRPGMRVRLLFAATADGEQAYGSGAGKQEADAAGEVDWSVAFVDGTVIRAHQHAAGAKGGTQKPRRWGAARVGSVLRSISRPTVPASR